MADQAQLDSIKQRMLQIAAQEQANGHEPDWDLIARKSLRESGFSQVPAIPSLDEIKAGMPQDDSFLGRHPTIASMASGLVSGTNAAANSLRPLGNAALEAFGGIGAVPGHSAPTATIPEDAPLRAAAALRGQDYDPRDAQVLEQGAAGIPGRAAEFLGTLPGMAPEIALTGGLGSLLRAGQAATLAGNVARSAAAGAGGFAAPGAVKTLLGGGTPAEAGQQALRGAAEGALLGAAGPALGGLAGRVSPKLVGPATHVGTSATLGGMAAAGAPEGERLERGLGAALGSAALAAGGGLFGKAKRAPRPEDFKIRQPEEAPPDVAPPEPAAPVEKSTALTVFDPARAKPKPKPKLVEAEVVRPEALEPGTTVDLGPAPPLTPTEQRAFYERKRPAMLNAPQGTVESKAEAGFRGLPPEAREAGAKEVLTTRGRVQFWPDMVEEVIRSRHPELADRPVAEAIQELAQQDALGEVLGYGEGNATKGAKAVLTGEKAGEPEGVTILAENPETASQALKDMGYESVRQSETAAEPLERRIQERVGEGGGSEGGKGAPPARPKPPPPTAIDADIAKAEQGLKKPIEEWTRDQVVKFVGAGKSLYSSPTPEQSRRLLELTKLSGSRLKGSEVEAIIDEVLWRSNPDSERVREAAVRLSDAARVDQLKHDPVYAAEKAAEEAKTRERYIQWEREQKERNVRGEKPADPFAKPGDPLGEEGSVDVGRIASRVKTKLTDPAKSEQLDWEMRNRSQLGMSKRLESVARALPPGLRRTAVRGLARNFGLPPADPRVGELLDMGKNALDEGMRLVSDLVDVRRSMTPEQETAAWFAAEKAGDLPADNPASKHLEMYRGLNDAASELGALASEHLRSVGEKPYLPRAVREQFRGEGKDYVFRMMSQEARAKLRGQANPDAVGQKVEGFFQRYFREMTNPDSKYFDTGLDNLAGKQKKIIQDVFGHKRAKLTPEEAAAVGYITNMLPIIRTTQMQAALYAGNVPFHAMRNEPRFRDLWREPKNDGNPDWIKAEGQGWGEMAGKEIHESAYQHLVAVAQPVRSGFYNFLQELNGSIKGGLTVLSFPLYHTKQAAIDNPLVAWNAGMSPWKMPWRFVRSMAAFAERGHADPGVTELIEMGMGPREGSQLLEIKEGHREGGHFENVQGRGLSYLKNMAKAFREQMGERNLETWQRLHNGRQSTPGWQIAADFLATLRESALNFDYGKPAGIKKRIQLGRAVTEAASLVDFGWRHMIWTDLKAKGYSKEQRARTIRGYYDPRENAPIVKKISNVPVAMAFIRFPLMQSRQLAPSSLGGRGHWKNKLIGTAVTLSTAYTVRELFKKITGISDEEEAELRLAAADGNKRKADELAVQAVERDKQGKIKQAWFVYLGNASLKAFLSDLADPGGRVLPHVKDTERWGPIPDSRTIRGLAASAPGGSLLYRQLTGNDPFTNEPPRDQSSGIDVTNALMPYVPGMRPIQNFLRMGEKNQQAEAFGQAPTWSPVERWLNSLFGVPLMTGSPPGTPEGDTQASRREYAETQERKALDATEFGDQFGYKRKFPKRPDEGASEEEVDQWQEAVKRWMMDNARRRAPRRR